MAAPRTRHGWTAVTPYLRVVAHRVNGTAIVRLAGELDVVSGAGLWGHLQRLLDDGAPTIVLDLSRLTSCDVAGVRVLLDLNDQALAEGRSVLLRHVHRNPRRVLELTGALAELRLDDPAGAPVPLGGEVPAVLGEALEEVIRLGGADMGNAQLHDPGDAALRLVAQRGFDREFLDFFDIVHDRETPCGTALVDARPVFVPDVSTSPIFVGTPGLDYMLDARARAVLSLPLRAPDGSVFGVVSAHYTRPRTWSDDERRRLERRARAAARAVLAG